MITVINGTNRADNTSGVFAEHFYYLVQKKSSASVKYLSLSAIPHDWFSPDMYDGENQHPTIAKVQDEYISPAQKLFIVSPEYNGGVSGVLKLFIDALSVRNYSSNFKNKKIGLAGTAAGRAGNLRGMDQLTQIFQHMGGIIMPQQLPISRISSLIEEDTITEIGTLKAMENHVNAFLDF